MPSVRIERLPVKTLGLGVLGFDHLQLVYVAGQVEISPEEDWFVIEGLREPSLSGARLGVEGLHGATTLAEANGGATGAILEAKIGTAEDRGSREIASGSDAARLWATFVAHASDLEAQSFPYVAYALPTSPLPTLNSSSLVSSLLHYAGLDIGDVKPDGLRFSPGTETLLGTSGDDVLSPVGRFTAVMGGGGADWLTGSFQLDRIDKLYGGSGNDHFQWSRGLNILHGGQPELAYASDGHDTAHYSGAGQVTIRATSAPTPHLNPDFIATSDSGEDQLFSIEEIVWDGEKDRILLGKGAGLVEMPITLTPGDEHSGAHGDVLDLSQSRQGLLVEGDGTGWVGVKPATHTETGYGHAVLGAEWIVGSAESDHIIAGTETRGIEGGAGDDVIDASRRATTGNTGPRGFEIEVAGGAGDDEIISGMGRISVRGGSGADLFVLGSKTRELIIEDAEPQDRLSIRDEAYAHIDSEGRTANDLLIRVSRGSSDDAAHHTTVRVLGFHDGDLGLSAAAPGQPLVLLDGIVALDGAQPDVVGLPWWLEELPPPADDLDPRPTSADFDAHAAALVYDAYSEHHDPCAADDIHSCPW